MPEHVMLRGMHDGYYVEDFEHGGTRFRLSDLTDEEYAAAMRTAADLAKQSGLGELGDLERVDAIALVGQLMKIVADPKVQAELQRGIRDMAAQVLDGGLVGWDIPGADGQTVPCTSETRALLPTSVKSELVQRILQLSQLQVGEAGFLTRLGFPHGPGGAAPGH